MQKVTVQPAANIPCDPVQAYAVGRNVVLYKSISAKYFVKGVKRPSWTLAVLCYESLTDNEPKAFALCYGPTRTALLELAEAAAEIVGDGVWTVSGVTNALRPIAPAYRQMNAGAYR